MKIKSIIIILFVAVLAGCGSNSNPSQTVSADKYQELLKESCLLTPDSLLTADQVAIKLKVLDFLYTNVTAEDNKQVLSATRKQMESKGIPAMYYDILQYQIHETNSFVERELKGGTMPPEALNVDIMLQEAKKRYWEEERPMLVLQQERMKASR